MSPNHEFTYECCLFQAGWFAIHYAAAEGYTDVVTALVEMGVRINLKDRVKIYT